MRARVVALREKENTVKCEMNRKVILAALLTILVPGKASALWIPMMFSALKGAAQGVNGACLVSSPIESPGEFWGRCASGVALGVGKGIIQAWVPSLWAIDMGGNYGVSLLREGGSSLAKILENAPGAEAAKFLWSWAPIPAAVTGMAEEVLKYGGENLAYGIGAAGGFSVAYVGFLIGNIFGGYDVGMEFLRQTLTAIELTGGLSKGVGYWFESSSRKAAEMAKKFADAGRWTVPIGFSGIAKSVDGVVYSGAYAPFVQAGNAVKALGSGARDWTVNMFVLGAAKFGLDTIYETVRKLISDNPGLTFGGAVAVGTAALCGVYKYATSKRAAALKILESEKKADEVAKKKAADEREAEVSEKKEAEKKAADKREAEAVEKQEAEKQAAEKKELEAAEKREAEKKAAETTVSSEEKDEELQVTTEKGKPVLGESDTEISTGTESNNDAGSDKEKNKSTYKKEISDVDGEKTNNPEKLTFDTVKTKVFLEDKQN